MVYTNQATISTIKEDLAVYGQNFIVGQVTSLQNPPPNLEEYSFEPNEVKLIVPLYSKETGKFQGLIETLAYIMPRGDQDEVFSSYGYSEENLQLVLFCSSKESAKCIYK